MDKKNIKHLITGKVFVLGDNIDTNQIIPAKYLSLVPTIREEYEKLGSFALSGLPSEKKYIAGGQTKTEYSIIIAGRNFGCGSSREHAPIALGAAGCRVVIAKSFARIFFRNSIATGELYPVESSDEILGSIKTGDIVEVDLDQCRIKNNKGSIFKLKPLGDALPVIDAGGLFEYSRREGLLRRAS